MTVTNPAAATAVHPIQLPQSFLSCYEITNPKSFAWSVRLYKIVKADGSCQSHGDRGETRQDHSSLWHAGSGLAGDNCTKC